MDVHVYFEHVVDDMPKILPDVKPDDAVTDQVDGPIIGISN